MCIRCEDCGKKVNRSDTVCPSCLGDDLVETDEK